MTFPFMVRGDKLLCFFVFFILIAAKSNCQVLRKNFLGFHRAAFESTIFCVTDD